MVYDDLDCVVSRTKKDLQTQEITEEAFQYEEACNIIASDEMGQLTKMSYDKNNCLKTYNDVVPKFDADGNMVSVALNGAQLELGYDSQNRLVKAGKTTYSYDPENHRLSSKEDSHRKSKAPILILWSRWSSYRREWLTVYAIQIL
jgi:hypothetical protein